MRSKLRGFLGVDLIRSDILAVQGEIATLGEAQERTAAKLEQIDASVGELRANLGMEPKVSPEVEQFLEDIQSFDPAMG